MEKRLIVSLQSGLNWHNNYKMKQLELSQGLFTLVDDEDYIPLNQIKWSASYHKRTKRWVACNSKAGLLHRYLLGIKDISVLVRHVNGNTLDNRRENLTVISPSISRASSKKAKNTLSKYRGVTLERSASHKRVKKWRADIQKECIGVFETPEEAALAYNKEAIKRFGEFATLNKVK